MEQITDWRNIRIYDEDGTQIKNPKTLRAMAEAMKLADAWEKRIDTYHLEEIFGRYNEENVNFDTEEKYC